MYSSDEEDIVLDPFLGSGQVAIVSKMMRRRYIGFEIVKEYYEFAQKRLDENMYRIKDKTKGTKNQTLLTLFGTEE